MAYLRYRLKNMIRGSFGMTRGKPVVYVSHDPEDLYITGKGFYSTVVKENSIRTG